MKKLIKKLKGFTLIELLAVIVILAIIALIAVPIVLNIIEDSRRSAAIESARGYVKAVNFKIAEEELKDKIITDGDYVIGNNAFNVAVKNSENIIGMYTIQDNHVMWAGLCVNNYSIVYNATTSYFGISEDSDYCEGEFPHIFVEPDGILVSEVYEDQTKYADNTYFKIKTVEDLVALSELVNGGKDFNSKTIYLVSNLDIENANSYKDSTKKTYGDINGDNTIDDLLTELTTGAGFKPIGTSEKTFNGAFIGYAFTIDNLMINRPSVGNVGLFGHITSGTINGIRLRNADVVGCSNTGGLAGYSTGSIKNIDVQANVSSTCNYVGGVVGQTWGGSFRITETVFKGTVSGANYVGGLLGANINNSQNLFGVVYNSTITATGSVGRVTTFNGPGEVRVYNTTAGSATDGTSIATLTLLSIDGTLDTIIGGDSDNDTYYFNIDENGEISLYSGDVEPPRNPKGEGTEQNPYIIRTVSDWNRAATTIDDTPHYYTLVSDLDFTNKTFYPFGSEQTKFNGVLLGNHHTISNVTVNGYNNTGLFGYITGTVKDINFTNITVVGSNNTGVIGYSQNGTISGVRVRNANITGCTGTGGLAGYATGTVKNVDVQATVSSTCNYVGGVIGNTNSGLTLTYATFTGTVSGGNYVSGILGANINNSNNIKSVVYNTTVTGTGGSTGKITTMNWPSDDNRNYNTTITGSGNDGVEIATLTLESVDGSLDTLIGGDDGDGYYFDYNSTGGIELYSTSERAIPTLNGNGTEASPYIISNANDWRAVVATIDNTPHYYSLTNDLDFTNARFYQLGTAVNKFNGVFMGNHHTISNVDVRGYQNIGVFGYITGTVKDVNFNNITVVATSNNAGIIGYSQNGTISGIRVRNANITGCTGTGGLAGYATGTIKNVDVQATVTSTCNYIGGVVGNTNSGLSLTYAVFKGTVSGGNYVSGILGANINNSNNIKSVVYNTTITGTGSSTGKITTMNWPGDDANNKNYNTTITGSGNNGAEISELTLDAVNSAIDTTIGGDNDGDGYYFTLTNGEYELITAN